MKKKYLLIFPLLILMNLLSVIHFANGFYCNLNFLNTNKIEYFIDEGIKINASWQLDYNINNEIAYVQVQLFDEFDRCVWNSSEYDEIGIFVKNWTLELENLTYNFNNNSFFLSIKFFSFYFQIDTTNTICTFLDTIKIMIIKREPLCQLTGYRDHIEYGESLQIKAKFYDELSENNINFINQTIEFLTTFNSLIIYQYNRTVNESGMVILYISSFLHLKIGQNFMIFTLRNNKIYNDSRFIYGIFVEKNPIYIDILQFTNVLKEKEDLELKLRYYYYFNQNQTYLADYLIIIKIFHISSLIFIQEFKTDKFGNLSVIIPQKDFNFNPKIEELTIKIIFNGTSYIGNKTLLFNLIINQDTIINIKKSFQVNFFVFLSILIIIIIFIMIAINNNRNKYEKLLSDLVIRY
ncbi:MAG: hypothetical protein ACFE9I_05210 [Candidatus Hermodarchaeota archaeon]